MKLKIVIIAALVVITSSDNTKTKKPKPNKPPKKINVTNWEYYRLKQELQVKSLKKILDSMTKFQKLESCPLGYGNCRYASVKYVLTGIIAAAIEKEKKEAQAREDKNKTLECEALLKRLEGNGTPPLGKSDQMKFGAHFRPKLSGIRRKIFRKNCRS